MLIMLSALTTAIGCSGDEPLNPSFPLRLDDAEAAMEDMAQHPMPAERPVVIAAGIFDPGVASTRLAKKLTHMLGPDAKIITVSFFGAFTFETCRERLVTEVEKAFGEGTDGATVEVDVVGISMGGMVARYAAAPRTDGECRLNIRRLFTISSPHRGANSAWVARIDPRADDMRGGSAFLAMLDDSLAISDYELYAYTRLNDWIVGTTNTAPPGRQAWWVAGVPFQFDHIQAGTDPRILADVARRLRGEAPYAMEPPAPFPGHIEEALSP